MNEEINYFEHFYRQASQDTGLLERNAHDYPYSSLAGFLLLYHYKKTNHPGFERLSKKTALHFKNSNWLQFLLDQPFDEKTVPAVISPGYPKDAKEIIEITSEEVTENKPAPVENFEIPQQAEEVKPEVVPEVIPRILPGKIVKKTYTEAAENLEPSPGEISFEPLHTVDYFASQGIKLTEEPAATDKLGNQVKSFTAWLKSMKKLHPSQFEEQDVASEKLIQNSAEESNINTEVITEAMAEVLIKQDKREKAIEMYNKLSLINPSKSAYFAAKIESIKSS